LLQTISLLQLKQTKFPISRNQKAYGICFDLKKKHELQQFTIKAQETFKGLPEIAQENLGSQQAIENSFTLLKVFFFCFSLMKR